ncbi:glycine cleavage system protein H [Paenibacillus sp. N3.4]|uniref:glycine cleavage system protein H n=1 Tax=Paenibacillus sp. N3.4 TaxID=2603222 RepID=UPI00164FF73F|nr:glycine cleavage system protein H [Paenibacillus sp. N3.4]
MSVPLYLKYTKDHYWIRQEGNQAIIGLTETGLIEMGMVLFIELPERDAVMRRGDYISSVETAQSEHDLFAPLSGKVTAVNLLLERAAMILHESPYDKGWLFAMEWSDESEFAHLWDVQTYEQQFPLD